MHTNPINFKNILHIQKYAKEIEKLLKEDSNIPYWVSDMLSSVSSKMSEVKHYLEFKQTGYFEYTSDCNNNCKCNKKTKDRNEIIDVVSNLIDERDEKMI